MLKPIEIAADAPDGYLLAIGSLTIYQNSTDDDIAAGQTFANKLAPSDVPCDVMNTGIGYRNFDGFVDPWTNNLGLFNMDVMKLTGEERTRFGINERSSMIRLTTQSEGTIMRLHPEWDDSRDSRDTMDQGFYLEGHYPMSDESVRNFKYNGGYLAETVPMQIYSSKIVWTYLRLYLGLWGDQNYT
eukprot:403987_1